MAARLGMYSRALRRCCGCVGAFFHSPGVKARQGQQEAVQRCRKAFSISPGSDVCVSSDALLGGAWIFRSAGLLCNAAISCRRPR
jgi:hypothetical protein